MLVEDFVNSINAYHQKHFNPSLNLTVNESILHWYGFGGDWIKEKSSMYIAIGRKLQNECEIQNVYNGKSGIMLQSLIVKFAKSAEHRNQ